MARRSRRALPKYLELHPVNRCYYYKNPSMTRKVNLGTTRNEALEIATKLTSRFEQQRTRADVLVRVGRQLEAVRFDEALSAFADKYIHDFRLKASTADRLRQRRDRLNQHLGQHYLPLIDTRMLRAAIATGTHFEQSKLRTLLARFFSYAISIGTFPADLPNPVDNLYIDPTPPKQRTRMTLAQFRAIYGASPEWLRWLLTLGSHLALRRVDLVSLRFDDIRGDRIVSPIRKTDTDARTVESISVDFPIHPDVRAVLMHARRSSIKNGRCPFVVHRPPERRTRRAADALGAGTLEHPAQVLPQYASKAFAKARARAAVTTGLFDGLAEREMPTLHEVRALSSHLYARAGYDVDDVQDLMAHTDPDMTRSYQRGHARKLVRVEMILPFGVRDGDPEIREPTAQYRAA